MAREKGAYRTTVIAFEKGRLQAVMPILEKDRLQVTKQTNQSVAVLQSR